MGTWASEAGADFISSEFQFFESKHWQYHLVLTHLLLSLMPARSPGSMPSLEDRWVRKVFRQLLERGSQTGGRGKAGVLGGFEQ